MLDLGPHAGFIVAAYGVTFVAVAALALFIVADDRKQRRLLAELERRGHQAALGRHAAKPAASKAGKNRGGAQMTDATRTAGLAALRAGPAAACSSPCSRACSGTRSRAAILRACPRR